MYSHIRDCTKQFEYITVCRNIPCTRFYSISAIDADVSGLTDQ